MSIMLKKEGEVRIPAGCAIAAMISRKGEKFTGEDIIRSIAVMHDRSNGLGGGFAAYGIYPEYKDFYAFHIFYDDPECRKNCENYLTDHFEIESAGRIPTRKVDTIESPHLIWRYFVKPKGYKVAQHKGMTDDEYIVRCVTRINAAIEGAFVFSSGKNMGCFKANGFPEEVGDFYMLENYKGYSWTCHGRFPTNTPGWWGGAHPMSIRDLTVVHNGEISSYDANRRNVEQFGYKCTLMTDTEVMTYLCDMLMRKHHLPKETVAHIMTAPTWEQINNMEPDKKAYYTALRTVYPGALVNGPFSIIVGYTGGLMALNDRLKLRSLMAAEKDDMVYFASEESAIRIICPEPDKIWSVGGGEPVIVNVDRSDV